MGPANNDVKVSKRAVIFLYDLRDAVRSLSRQRGFAAVAVTTLALGLGLNTAVFAVAYGILWRPLPYPEPNRLVSITTHFQDGDGGGIRLNTFNDWTDRLRTADPAGYQTVERALRGVGPARIVNAAIVTENCFRVLGLSAAQGVAPPLPPGDPRVVISARLARTLATTGAAEPVGQAVTIGDESYVVTGVMPAAFALPTADVDAWVAVPPPPVANAGSGSYELIGRLRDGITLAQVGADADRVVRDINSAEWSAVVRTLESVLLDDTRPALQVSLAAAVLVLVVACASTTTLMIGRSVARGREFALRRALGAGAGRLARAAVVEGLVIAGGGLTVGLFMAWAGLRLFTTRAAGVLPRLSEIGLDLPALLAAGALTLTVALVCGGASAAGAMRRDTTDLLRGTVLTGTPLTRRLRAALVAAQLAMAIVLLTGAGLLARSVSELLAEDGGFEPERVLTAKLMLGDSRFLDDASQTGFVRTLLTRGDPTALVPTLRTLIMQLNPTLPLPGVRTLDDHIAGSIAGRRLQLAPAAAVAALALAVAMVGLFGTLGRAVTERRQELSIRAAVGASPARLVRLVLRGSLAVTALGLTVGLAAAAATGRGLSSLLYGVSPYDPLTFALVTGTVLIAALTASIVPARRAARLDPLIALKGE